MNLEKLKPRPIVNNGKEVWCVDLRAMGKGRKFFADKAEAKAISDAWKAEAINHGSRAFDLTDEDRIQFLAAKERLAARGATIAEAVDLFLQIGPVREAKTISEAIEALIQNRKENGARDRYLTQLRSTLYQFKKDREDTLCTRVSIGDVRDWLNGNGWGPKTRKGKLIDVRTLFAFAKESGWCSVIPCPKPSDITLDDKPPGILTVEECRALMKAAQEHATTLIPYLSLCLFAGIRPEEASQMTWGDVDFESELVTVRAEVAKTRKRRHVKLSANAIAWLKLGGELPAVNLKRKFELVRDKAKIIVWPHDAMRHSFASYHLAQHGSADKTATEMGHSSTDMLFQHYRELVKPKLALEFWGVTPEAL